MRRTATLHEQFACLCVAHRQAEADRLEAASKRKLEVLGYGE
jgi:hypothetical protein